MKNKSITIRLSPVDIARLEETAKMRSELASKSINYTGLLPKESSSELIRQAILRMYNETLEYIIYESEDFIKSNKTDS